jgi:hypothetical protein
MSRIRQIRESVDAKLDKLDARADALEATLRGTEDHIHDRIERGKQELHQALDTLKADVEKSKQFSAAHKQKIRAEIDDLKVQIALGKAEAGDALAAARRRFHEDTRKVEAEMDSALQAMNAEMLDASIYVYVRATDKLDAELEAAEARFASAKEKVDAAFDKHRQEMSQKIADVKQRLAERKKHTSEKLVQFEEEIRGGFEQMAKAFKDLFA